MTGAAVASATDVKRLGSTTAGTEGAVADAETVTTRREANAAANATLHRPLIRQPWPHQPQS